MPPDTSEREKTGAPAAGAGMSAALSRHDVGLVKEPEAAASLKDFAGCIEIPPVRHDLRQALVVDLRHVDRGIPGGEQGRSTDAFRDLARQGMHVVAEHCACIRVGVEIEMTCIAPQLFAHRAQDVVPPGVKRILLRPDLAHDLHARVASKGMDAKKTSPKPE